MSVQSDLQIFRRPVCAIVGLLVLCLGLLSATSAALAETAPAKSVGLTATLVRRTATGQPWHLVKEGEALPAGQLLVGMHGAALDSADGGVRLSMLTDLDGNAPYPVVESAVILRDNPKADLDFILDRGRVDLVNRRPHGPARVRLQVR